MPVARFRDGSTPNSRTPASTGGQAPLRLRPDVPIICARIIELYDTCGLAAFQSPGVQKAIDLLLDAGEGIRVIQARHTEDEAGGGTLNPADA